MIKCGADKRKGVSSSRLHVNIYRKLKSAYINYGQVYLVICIHALCTLIYNEDLSFRDRQLMLKSIGAICADINWNIRISRPTRAEDHDDRRRSRLFLSGRRSPRSLNLHSPLRSYRPILVFQSCQSPTDSADDLIEPYCLCRPRFAWLHDLTLPSCNKTEWKSIEIYDTGHREYGDVQHAIYGGVWNISSDTAKIFTNLYIRWKYFLSF